MARTHYIEGPGSVATGYGLDGPEIESRWGGEISAPVQTGLGPTQPPVQWVPGLSRGAKVTPHRLLVPWSRKSRSITLLLLLAVRPVQSLSASGCTLPFFKHYIHTSFRLT